MDPSPSRMSKIIRRKSEQIGYIRPGPMRQPSKPIDRPLSRQKELADNPKSLYLVAQPSSLESETMIIRNVQTSFKDLMSPDPVIADESEELSQPYDKSDLIKDNEKSNDLKFSNSDTLIQPQKPQIYPPEFVR